MSATAHSLAPAKLNLFLELLAKRDDGYHEIDTVMVPINWTDSLVLRKTSRPGVQLSLEWLPSRQILARRLGVAGDPPAEATLLEIPVDQRNLICRALDQFLTLMNVKGGCDCQLVKQIPAGAGMGGASSNAASALLAAAELFSISITEPKLQRLAADLGSDVPFFLGQATDLAKVDQPGNRAFAGTGGFRAARGTGRGERVEPLILGTALDLVVVFPARMLSTPKVYSQSKIAERPESACNLIQALGSSRRSDIYSSVFNRLTEPAIAIEPNVEKTLRVMQHSGLYGCQMTGSGSACFGFAMSARHARRMKVKLTTQLQPGAFVRACRTIRVPSGIVLR